MSHLANRRNSDMTVAEVIVSQDYQRVRPRLWTELRAEMPLDLHGLYLPSPGRGVPAKVEAMATEAKENDTPAEDVAMETAEPAEEPPKEMAAPIQSV
eukprot:s874_g19.t1